MGHVSKRFRRSSSMKAVSINWGSSSWVAFLKELYYLGSAVVHWGPLIFGSCQPEPCTSQPWLMSSGDTASGCPKDPSSSIDQRCAARGAEIFVTFQEGFMLETRSLLLTTDD